MRNGHPPNGHKRPLPPPPPPPKKPGYSEARNDLWRERLTQQLKSDRQAIRESEMDFLWAFFWIAILVLALATGLQERQANQNATPELEDSNTATTSAR